MPKQKDAKRVIVSNLEKVFWPKEKYTKGDVLNYYREMAPVMLPYLKDRPLSLNRHPDGIDGESFFQKDVSNLHLPRFVKTETIRSKSTDEDVKYMLCQNKSTLEYIVNLGCIEINPWNSRVGKIIYPDYMVIDLDPQNVSFKQVVKAAKEVYKVLEKLQIPSVCKTSGGNGLHIYVPLGAKYTHKQARQFAKLIGAFVEARASKLVSIKKRTGTVYIDTPQNRKGSTNVCVYSLRPRPGANVSMPLKWSEVNEKLSPKQFTIETAARRVEKVGDLFQPILGKGIDMKKILDKHA